MSLPMLLLSLLIAQQPQAPASTGNNPATANPDEKKLGKVEGVVVNSISKELIRRAEVSLMPMDRPQNMAVMGPGGIPGTRKATSDAEGKFVITDVEPGRYFIRGQKSGFISGRVGSRGNMFGGSAATITVSPGQTVTGAKAEMTPQAIVSGRVLDEEGEPLQNIMVQILRSQYMRGRKQMIPMGGGQTNDKGEFRVANVPPGQVILSISPPRFGNGPTGSTDEKSTTAYVQTYYPGATEMAQAAKIDVTAGAELSGFDMKLLKGRVTRIRGKVLDSAGQPMKNYFVQVMPKESGFFMGFMMNNFVRQQDGSFELSGIQPGSYNLVVQGQMMPGAGSGPQLSYREPLEVGTENIDNLIVRVPPAIKLEGQISIKGNPPTNFDKQSVRIQLSDESGRFFGPMGQQTVKEDGSFVLENVMPGKYRINAFGGGFGPSGYSAGGEGVYLDSVFYGNQEVTGKEIEITDAAPVKVIFAVGGGSVTGSVTKDGAPMPGVSVLLLSTNVEKRDMPFTKTGMTDQNGNYSMKTVAPGDYLVLALDEMEYGFWFEEERLKKVEGKAAKISVSSSGATSANLTVTSLPD